ncbi:hypothetical protein M426DRAFT_208231 [Hypoxylon sp. CI-4A]|nr:hypothetical protein M426DRAFT_208231 [Hypoxylon sp. CI-4A]
MLYDRASDRLKLELEHDRDAQYLPRCAQRRSCRNEVWISSVKRDWSFFQRGKVFFEKREESHEYESKRSCVRASNGYPSNWHEAQWVLLLSDLTIAARSSSLGPHPTHN